MKKKLYRSTKDKKLAGVCGGFADYLGIDPTLVRIIWAVISWFAGFGIILYIICALVVPEQPEDEYIDV